MRIAFIRPCAHVGLGKQPCVEHTRNRLTVSAIAEELGLLVFGVRSLIARAEEAIGQTCDNIWIAGVRRFGKLRRSCFFRWVVAAYQAQQLPPCRL
jgi:hypothetical protein